MPRILTTCRVLGPSRRDREACWRFRINYAFFGINLDDGVTRSAGDCATQPDVQQLPDVAVAEKDRYSRATINQEIRLMKLTKTLLAVAAAAALVVGVKAQTLQIN